MLNSELWNPLRGYILKSKALQFDLLCFFTVQRKLK